MKHIAGTLLLLSLFACGPIAAPSIQEEPSAPQPEVIDPSAADPAIAVAEEAGPFEYFDDMAAMVRADLERVTGVELADLDFHLADEDTMAHVVLRSQEALGQGGLDEDDVRAWARALLGVYDYVDTHAVYVCPENLAHAAEIFDMPELNRAEVVYAIMAHEGAHGVADREYDLLKLMQKGAQGKADGLMAASSVIEGYAQWVAGSVCAEGNRRKGFERFTQAIGTSPKLGDPGSQILTDNIVAQTSFSYYSGLEFVQAVHAKGGMEAIAAVFAAPPTSRTDIANPGWYLDPSSRPRSGLDLDAALACLPPRLETSEGMQFMQREVGVAELLPAAQMVGPQATQEMKDSVVSLTVKIGQTPDGGQMVVLGAIVCNGEAGAASYIDIGRQISLKKDEQLAGEGFLQILSSEEVPLPRWRGYHLRQGHVGGRRADSADPDPGPPGQSGFGVDPIECGNGRRSARRPAERSV
ncbi:MAG: hypothetical protein R3F33_01085 [Planctomycetota bacterium]